MAVQLLCSSVERCGVSSFEGTLTKSKNGFSDPIDCKTHKQAQ